MTSGVFPIQLERTANRAIRVIWSDGLRQSVSFRVLRDHCPCAHCREKKMKPADGPPAGALPVLSAAEARPLDVVSMTPVGNYGYNITFSDGHASGIFTFEMLRAFENPGGENPG